MTGKTDYWSSHPGCELRVKQGSGSTNISAESKHSDQQLSTLVHFKKVLISTNLCFHWSVLVRLLGMTSLEFWTSRGCHRNFSTKSIQPITEGEYKIPIKWENTRTCCRGNNNLFPVRCQTIDKKPPSIHHARKYASMPLIYLNCCRKHIIHLVSLDPTLCINQLLNRAYILEY